MTKTQKPPLLPKGLNSAQIQKAVKYIEKKASEIIEIYYEQANVFSGIVGIFGAQALDAFSPYKKHKHPDVAQERFPDSSYGGRINPPPELALESKGSIRPWAIQAHYDHAGWYIIWRYMIDPTKSINGSEVVVWRVDVVFLSKDDWKYERSNASESGGGRTHTFGLRNPSKKLKGCAVYSLPSVVIKNSRPVLVG
jgi:hypothetical protein